MRPGYAGVLLAALLTAAAGEIPLPGAGNLENGRALNGQEWIEAGRPAAEYRGLTLEGWFYPKETRGRQGLIVGREAEVPADARFFLQGTDLVFNRYVKSGGYWVRHTLPGAVEADRWYHLAVTVEGNGKTTFYVDGKASPSKRLQGSLPEGGTPWTVGRDFDSEPFFGHMDEVRIWNRARTGAEIRGMMDLPAKGDEEGLVVRLGFDTPGEGRLALQPVERFTYVTPPVPEPKPEPATRPAPAAEEKKAVAAEKAAPPPPEPAAVPEKRDETGVYLGAFLTVGRGNLEGSLKGAPAGAEVDKNQQRTSQGAEVRGGLAREGGNFYLFLGQDRWSNGSLRFVGVGGDKGLGTVEAAGTRALLYAGGRIGTQTLELDGFREGSAFGYALEAGGRIPRQGGWTLTGFIRYRGGAPRAEKKYTDGGGTHQIAYDGGFSLGLGVEYGL